MKKEEKMPETKKDRAQEQSREEQFLGMIKGEFKDLFQKRAQQMIDARFKQTKNLEEQLEKAKAFEPVIDALCEKFGVSKDDPQALLQAVLAGGNEAQESAAAQESVERRDERQESAAAQESAERRDERQESAGKKTVEKWYAEEKEVQKLYPGFSLENEVKNPETGRQFLNLIKNGIGVKVAFQAVHIDDMIESAMQFTAATVQQKTLNDIRARGLRPSENGGAVSPGGMDKKDPSRLTKKEREEIARKVLRGEKVSF